MMSIIETLRQEHRDIEQLLLLLEEEMDIFDRGDQPDYEIVQAVISYLQDYPDCCHHPKENMVFARLKTRDPAVAAGIGDLEADHESEAHSLQRVAYTIWRIRSRRDVARETFDEVMRDFIGNERRHMEMEEVVLFPAALAALEPGDWAGIEAAWSHRRDSLFTVGIEEKCQSLRERILRWQERHRTGQAVPHS
jgi:hemerythrin-like domain-containing protein